MPSRPLSSTPIRTPDHRLRVFVSSTLQELLPERQAVTAAITRLHLSPVLFELGARPHPPRELYRAYLEQSHIFVGIYWERYGWVAPGEEISGLEDEYCLCGDKPKLIYVKAPAPEREPRLRELLGRIRDDDTASYKPFSSASELGRLLSNDLALLLTERFEATLERPQVAPLPAPTPATSAPWPQPATPLIGRERERAALHALLASDEVRLVTLLGLGGIGKSRLALTLADAVPAARAVFVPLAGLSDPALVFPAIAGALDISEAEGESPSSSVQRALQNEPTLLVLDNFEQVGEAATEVGALLTACPKLKVVVTSRSPLYLSAEHEFPVPPLERPEANAPLASLRETEAVQLFVARAQAVKPTFALTLTNASSVAEITRRLDGLPLALELAASRIKLLSPEELLARLERRFELLASRSRDLPTRQQTLRATIDWSFRLLPTEAAQTLLELSVFVGSWSLAAAEQVCTLGGSAAFLEHVATLVDNSLVVPADTPEEARFRLLESIRAYAFEKLEAEGEAEAVQVRHAEYFAAMVQEAREHLLGEGQLPWLARLETEHDNLRVALGWLAAQRPGEPYGRFATSLIHFWWIRGHYSEGRRWLEGALTHLEPSSALRGRALDGVGVLAWVQGDYDTAWTSYEASLEQSRAAGSDEGVASSLGNLGIIALERGDLPAARAYLEEGLAINRRLDNLAGLAPSLINLSLVTVKQGDFAASRAQLEEALAINRARKDSWGVTTVLINLGDVLCAQGETSQARAHFAESLRLAQELGDKESLAYALEGFGNIAATQGQAVRAVHLWGAAEALRQASGNPRPPSSGADTYEQDTELMRAELGDASFDEHWAQGRATPLEETVAFALEDQGAHADGITPEDVYEG